MNNLKFANGLWIPESVFQIKGLNSRDRILLSNIIAYSKSNGCYTSTDRFIQELGMTKDQVYRSLKKLQEKGITEHITINTSITSKSREIKVIEKNLLTESEKGLWLKRSVLIGDFNHNEKLVFSYLSNLLKQGIDVYGSKYVASFLGLTNRSLRYTTDKLEEKKILFQEHINKGERGHSYKFSLKDHDKSAKDHDNFAKDHDKSAKDHDKSAKDHDKNAKDHDKNAHYNIISNIINNTISNTISNKGLSETEIKKGESAMLNNGIDILGINTKENKEIKLVEELKTMNKSKHPLATARLRLELAKLKEEYWEDLTNRDITYLYVYDIHPNATGRAFNLSGNISTFSKTLNNTLKENGKNTNKEKYETLKKIDSIYSNSRFMNSEYPVLTDASFRQDWLIKTLLHGKGQGGSSNSHAIVSGDADDLLKEREDKQKEMKHINLDKEFKEFKEFAIALDPIKGSTYSEEDFIKEFEDFLKMQAR